MPLTPLGERSKVAAIARVTGLRTVVRFETDDVQEETMTMPESAPASGRPLVLRGGTVLTMDDAATVLTGTPTSWSSTTGSRRSARAWTCPRARRRSTPAAAS